MANVSDTPENHGDWVRLRNRVEYLERVIAYEARVIEAQTLDLTKLAKCRRTVLEGSVEAMRQVVTEGHHDRYADNGAYKELDNLRPAEALSGD